MNAVSNIFATVGTNHKMPVDLISPQLVMKPSVPPRIFLVDDDPVFCKIMERTANIFGTELRSVRDIDELAEQPLDSFDVAIIDYDLGTVTGPQIAWYIDRWAGLPIIMISQTDRAPENGWSDSIRDFVHKNHGPFAILDAAFEAHEVSLIHKNMNKRKKNVIRFRQGKKH